MSVDIKYNLQDSKVFKKSRNIKLLRKFTIFFFFLEKGAKITTFELNTHYINMTSYCFCVDESRRCTWKIGKFPFCIITNNIKMKKGRISGKWEKIFEYI